MCVWIKSQHILSVKTSGFITKFTVHRIRQNQDQVTGKGSEVQNNQSTHNNAGLLSAGTRDNLAESASQTASYVAPLIVHNLPVCLVSKAVQVCWSRCEQQGGEERRATQTESCNTLLEECVRDNVKKIEIFLLLFTVCSRIIF